MTASSSANGSPSSKCSECGTAIFATAKFCGECGTTQPSHASEVATASTAGRRASIAPEDATANGLDGYHSENRSSPLVKAKSVFAGAAIGFVVLAVVAAVPLFRTLQKSAPSSIALSTSHSAEGDAVAAPTPESEATKLRVNLKLLNNDPEYDRLRKLNPYDVIGLLPSYREAVERRDNLIRAKVGNVSDPSLYSQLAASASESIPQISKDDYLKAAEAEVQKQRTAYAELHKDDYFIIGTYESYYPDTQKVVFNLRKEGISENAEDFSRANFGLSIPQLKTDYGSEQYDESFLGPSHNGWIQGVDTTSVLSLVSPDRYKPDWLTDYSGALVVTVPVEQMDAVYTADAKLTGTLIDKLYAEEMAAGGYHSSVDGRFHLYSDYSAEWLSDMKNHIGSFVRRQSIWIVGRGDPMNPDNVRVREAYLVVGNERFAKLK